MADLLVRNGTIVTMDSDRKVVGGGAVAVEDSEIVSVGPTEEVADRYDGDEIIDAAGSAVIPGFVDPHTHVSDVLLRGRLSRNRSLFDWLFNVKKPGVYAMTPEDHELAAALFCAEAIRAGITTFVELPEAVIMGDDDHDQIVERKLDVYDAAGIQNVYASTFRDNDDVGSDFEKYIQRLIRREPSVEHVPPTYSLLGTDEALDRIKGLINQYHSPTDRQSVWPAPEHIWTASADGLHGAYELADSRDVMTTTHVSETVHDESAMISANGRCWHTASKSMRGTSGDSRRQTQRSPTTH